MAREKRFDLSKCSPFLQGDDGIYFIDYNDRHLRKSALIGTYDPAVDPAHLRAIDPATGNVIFESDVEDPQTAANLIIRKVVPYAEAWLWGEMHDPDRTANT